MSALFYVSVALVAAILSIARIVVTNFAALSTLVWAEDGLFPLCVSQHGYLPCLVDPFAGYFLFLSRTLAVPVSWFPLDAWPLATNVVAATSVGATAALIAWLVVRSGWGKVPAFIVGLIPVVVPIAGFEAVNAAGSVYMMLLVAAAMAVSLPAGRNIPVWSLGMILAATSLTIPSSVILLAPLAFTLLTRPRQLGRLFVGVAALIVGLIVQLLVSVTAANPRPIAISAESFGGWVQGLPAALMTLWPSDVVLGPTGVLETQVTLSPATGWVTLGLLAIVAIGLALIGRRREDSRITGVGLLVGVGVLLGAVPAVAGFANNRYYVIPIAVVGIATVLAIAVLARRRAILATLITAAVLAVLWAPGFGAGQYRSTASPPWPDMLAQARTVCEGESADVALTFSPNWPFPDAVFPGVTSQRVPCEWLLRATSE